MTLRKDTLAKLDQLPDSLLDEVNQFIDFLLFKHHPEQWPLSILDTELAELGMANYSEDLNHYEEQLAQGEIQW